MVLLIEITKAYHFTALKHVNQRRKGVAAEPYINHLTEVAELVAVATRGNDIDLVMAAVLHDTIEDTATTVEELAAAFGLRVAELVAEVTDDKSLPKLERKRLQIEHAALASPRAKMIKIADKVSNLRALGSSPPAGWSRARIEECMAWAIQVVAGCRGVNFWLESEFDNAAKLVCRGGPSLRDRS